MSAQTVGGITKCQLSSRAACVDYALKFLLMWNEKKTITYLIKIKAHSKLDRCSRGCTARSYSWKKPMTHISYSGSHTSKGLSWEFLLRAMSLAFQLLHGCKCSKTWSLNLFTRYGSQSKNSRKKIKFLFVKSHKINSTGGFIWMVTAQNISTKLKARVFP